MPAVQTPIAPGYGSVHDVIDARAVVPVFQPLVRLDNREVVGYEALSRGPAGSAFEMPGALFGAAARVGRLPELDWVCRARACEAAMRAGLHPALTLFVNVEPAALGTLCPPDLAPVFRRAMGRLRVVTEMTERRLAHDPSGLLVAAAAGRASGWGVALDDVGAEPASLAIMPFLQPDVVKLDMHLLHHPDEPTVPRVVNAVIAHAERTGATVLAEGIETEEHLALARTMGATLGQGWLFGAGAPLPTGTVRPSQPVPLLPVSVLRGSARTPFDIVSEQRPIGRADKALLLRTSRYLEAKAMDEVEPPVLLACFQERRHLGPGTVRRYQRLAGRTAYAAVFGAGVPVEAAAGIRGVDLGAGDPLRREWNVVVVGPYFAAALVARDLGDDGPDRERRFDYALTYDRTLVLEAARALLHRVSAPALAASAAA
jgi:EAL domain-containing protein (putative c-di-GMP-specific phosphodiesterase class I)